ncbi:MAG: phosphatase PAP2 family protein [Acidobacteriota bacterium]
MGRNLFIRALAWLGRHELATLLAVGSLAAGVWLFAALADEVMEGGTRKMDRAVLLALRHPGDLQPIGSPALLNAARDITALGSPAILGLITAALSLFLALDGKKRMALFVFGSITSGLLASVLLKDSFERPRPDIVSHEVYASSSSFPSGHSMMSALTYLTLGALLARSQQRKFLKAYFLLIAVFLTVLIGATRVYLGVHWPTDVLAGWTAGAVWALLCWLLARWLQIRHALEPEAKH